MTTPAIHFATHRDSAGRLHSLAIVVTHWRSEGSAIYERISADGQRNEVVENATWFRQAGEDGASVLRLEIPEGEADGEALDFLMAALVDQGFADGFDPVAGF